MTPRCLTLTINLKWQSKIAKGWSIRHHTDGAKTDTGQMQDFDVVRYKPNNLSCGYATTNI